MTKLKLPQFGDIVNAANLLPQDANKLSQLLRVLVDNHSRNEKLVRYRDAEVTASEVNIGISIPKKLTALDFRCSWAGKAVSSLQNLSRFDAYLTENAELEQDLKRISTFNQLPVRYNRALSSVLTHGVAFATVNRGENDFPIIQFHTALSSAALWNGAENRIDCGLVVLEYKKFNRDTTSKPSIVQLYTDTDVVVLERTDGTHWYAEYRPHSLGRPLMEPLIYMPTDDQPFGHSRISKDVMRTVDEIIRIKLRLSIAGETAAVPKKVLMGVTEAFAEDFSTFNAYMTDFLTLTKNQETNENPEIVQLPAASTEPIISAWRAFAADFSGSTDVPINRLGIIQDNPSSAEAIYASEKALIERCETMNDELALPLYNIGLLALDILYSTRDDNADETYVLPEELRDFTPHFRSPSMASMAAQADAVTKMAAADPAFAGTDEYYAMMDIDKATIRRIQSQKKENTGNQLMQSILGGE